MIFSVLCHFQ